MPRTRKPQASTPSVQGRGRVANTTTSSLPQVYRFGTGKSHPSCKAPTSSVTVEAPLHVQIVGDNVYHVTLNMDELKSKIEDFETLDLSNVTLTVGTLQGPVTISGNLNVNDGTFTTDNGSISNLISQTINSTNATITNLEAVNSSIENEEVEALTVTATATIEKAIIKNEEVESSKINNAEIITESVTNSTIANATIAEESVTNSTIANATIVEESVTNSVINQLGVNQAHATSLTAVQATVSREFNSNGTATFNGENVFNSDITANESINVAGDTNLNRLNVESVSNFNGQLNANENVLFDKNVNVNGVTNVNTFNAIGYANFNDRATFNEDVIINDTLTQNSNAQFNGQTNFNTITATGEATFKDAVQMDKNLNVDGNAVVEGNQRIDGSLSVGKESEFKSHLNVQGKLNAEQNVEVAGNTKTSGLEVTTRAEIKNENVETSTIKKLTVTDELIIPDEALAPFQARSEKDKANGYAGLDENGKISIDELPDSVTTGMHYRGTWEPSSSYPSNPSIGDFYKVSADGVKDGVEFSVGDIIIYNGSAWDRIPSADDVISVNGKTGAVTGLEEVTNKVTVLDKTNPSQVKYTSEYAVANALSEVEGEVAEIAYDLDGLTSVVASKANSDSVYTKLEIDQKLDDVVAEDDSFIELKNQVNSLPTKEYVDGKDNLKANVSDVYDKTVMDKLLADKAHITHTHTVSDIAGLSDRLATIEASIDSASGDISDVENDINELKDDVLTINNTLGSKADLVGGKVPLEQLPDNLVTTDNLSDAVAQAITKTMLETRLGVSFRTFAIPLTGQTTCYNDNWFTERTNVIWTWTGELEGVIVWRTEDGRICVESTESETGTFYLVGVNPA